MNSPIFGLVCDDCGEPYASEEWLPPFQCGTCRDRETAGTLILSQPA